MSYLARDHRSENGKNNMVLKWSSWGLLAL